MSIQQMLHEQRSKERGFTLIEMAIVVLILLIAVTIGVPMLQNLLSRYKLMGAAQTTGSILQIARFEAVKTGSQTVARIVPATNQVQAFVDDNANGDLDAGERVLRDYQIPDDIILQDAGGNSPGVDGFTAGPAGRPNQAVFNSNGSVDTEGAFRISDLRENYLEIRIAPRATARIALQKYDPAASGADKWFERYEQKGWEWN